MNAKICVSKRLQKHYGQLVTAGAALLLVLPWGAEAGGVVTNCTEAALRAAMAGGETVTFACDGTITLGAPITVATDTLIDGAGHQVALSGNGYASVFHVNTGTQLTVANLTITDGRGVWGGAISNDGGSLTLVGVKFQNNVATNAEWIPFYGAYSEGGVGGAIYNLGTLNATNCAFIGNVARQRETPDSINLGDPYADLWVSLYVFTPCRGGAIYSSGVLNLTGCSFEGNGAFAAPGYTLISGFGVAVGATEGRTAAGGAIHSSMPLTLSSCTFSNNVACSSRAIDASSFLINEPFPPAAGLNATAAFGGAVNAGSVSIYACSFISNRVIGGAGGAGGTGGSTSGAPGGGGGGATGGALCISGGNMSHSALVGNAATGGAGGAGGYGNDPIGHDGGPGAAGGDARGGALSCSGLVLVSNCTAAGNAATGGAGGAGGAGGRLYDYGYDGGPGGTGGDAHGGALSCSGLALVNCTAAGNLTIGGTGGEGGPGAYSFHMTGNGGAGGYGGDAYAMLSGVADALTNCTLALNQAAGGAGGAGGRAGGGSPGAPGAGGAVSGGLVNGSTVLNCVLATNQPANCSGWVNDIGHNLSSDAGCFTNSTSGNGVDPRLAPLAMNGGPTLTMALLPGSPAIDAGNTSLAPATDQRGFPRPAGVAADIGAFEYGSVMPALAISRSGATGLNILASGNANQPCRLLSSPDLSSWVPMATNQIGGDGTVLFYDECDPGGTCRFYRLVMP